jgi:hypothetical protein
MRSSATTCRAFRPTVLKSRPVAGASYTERIGAGDRVARGGVLVLYFFLSYAHGDPQDDKWVAQFFADFSTEIRVLTGDRPVEVVGFHDHRNLRAGDLWPEELVDALSAALTFIPLCSPRYFRSRYCGQEWTVFADRVAAFRRSSGRQPPSIIPVFWAWTEIPEALGDLHHRDPSFGAHYQADGLRELLRLERHRDYRAFVRALAIRVHDVATRFPLPAARQRPDFRSVPSAFGAHTGPPDPPTPGPPAPLPDPHQPREQHTPPERPILELDPPDVTDSP